MNNRSCLLLLATSMCFALGGCSNGSPENPSTAPQAETAGAASGTRCFLDKFNDKSLRHDGSDVLQQATRAFTLEGWFVDHDHRSVTGLHLVFSPVASAASIARPAQSGLERTDVAKALNNAAAGHAGFAARIEANTLTPGRYRMAVAANAGGNGDSCNLKTTLRVVKAGQP